MPVERPRLDKESPIEHTILVYKKPTTGRIMLSCDGYIRGANELKARILRALTRGPINRREYLEEVFKRDYEGITWRERHTVNAAQKSLGSIPFLRFPNAARSHAPIQTIYALPQGVKVLFEQGVLEAMVEPVIDSPNP